MQQIPTAISARFLWELNRKQIPRRPHPYYLKWLRSYLDFCLIYGHDALLSKSLPLFLNTLYEKNQTGAQRDQAARAAHLYYQLVHDRPSGVNQSQPTPKKEAHALQPKSPSVHRTISDSPKPDDARSAETRASGSRHGPQNGWKLAMDSLSNEIMVRHYSPKTLMSCSAWVRKFQSRCRNPPFALDTHDACAAGQLRYPHHPGTAGAQRCANDHDLHPYRKESNHRGRQKPPGFLIGLVSPRPPGQGADLLKRPAPLRGILRDVVKA